MHYLEITKNVYRQAAGKPEIGLCCTNSPIWQLPGLAIPPKMLDMNYGCGTTVHPRDLAGHPKVLYVGVGGGMELLQFAYFSRESGSIIGVDTVSEMLEICEQNLQDAEALNNWFRPEFVSLLRGDALSLPVDDHSVDVAAQNCLFNIFRKEDLRVALHEMYRVLKPGGRLVLSDPTCEQGIPDFLSNDDRLRALCLSGALTLDLYIDMIAETGFGTIEIRGRRPYRILDPGTYGIEAPIFIESVEVCAIKEPVPADGPCVFTGRTATYYGDDESFDDQMGHVLMRGLPISVCDKTANSLMSLKRDDIFISPSTWHYQGGGCC